MTSPSNRGRWVVLGLSALLATILLAPLQMMPFGRLSALYAVCARVLEADFGAARDVFTTAPPGTALWYLAARVLIGPLEGDARLFEWIWMTLTFVVAALVVYEWTDRKAWAGVLVAIALALQHVAGGFSLTMLSGQLAMLPLMIGLGLWGSPVEARRWKRAAGSVPAFAVSALFSPLAVIAVVVLSLVELARLVKKRWSLGNVVPGLVTAVVSFACARSISDWMRDWCGIAANLGGWFFSPEPTHFNHLCFITLLTVLGWLAIGALFVRQNGDVFLALCVAGLVVFSDAGVWNSLWTGHWTLLVFAAPIAAAEYATLAAAKSRWRWFRLAIIALLAIVVVAMAWPMSAVKQYRLFWRYLSGEVATSMAGSFTVEDQGGVFVYSEVREVAGWLARSAQPGWQLLVLGREPGLYHYSELPPAGPIRWIAGARLGVRSDRFRLPLVETQPEMVVLTPYVRDRRDDFQRALKELGYLSAGRYLGYRLYLRGDVAATAFPPK